MIVVIYDYMMGLYIDILDITYLVGGWPTSEKYEFVSWEKIFPIYGKLKKTCSKPPTRYGD